MALILHCSVSMRRGGVYLGVLFALMLAIGQRAAPAQKSDAEAEAYEAQSQYLRSFVEFVNWPASSQSQSVRATMNFCVLGDDPYGKLLDDAVLGHSFWNRRGVIVRGRTLGDLGVCDVLFVGKSEEKHESRILKKLSNQNVLTISDTSDFAAHGGIIQLVWQKDHIGFVINVDAANRAGLKINASLLALAQIVHDPAEKSAP